MKKLTLLIIILFSVSFSYSQEKEKLSEKEKARRQHNIDIGNPFARFGYKPKIATLSKGKYLEFHDRDSIVKIGSFTYNTRKKVITGFIDLDTVRSEATLRPELISRWFNPDPLSDEFPSWSPYNYVKNNPIMFIDPDGRATKHANCCGNLSTGAGIGFLFNRFKNTANYIRQGNSISTSYLMATRDDAIDATKQTLRYTTPTEDIYGVATGQDFYGNPYNRAKAAGWTALSFIPFAKLGKLGKLGKIFNKSDNFIEYAVKGADDVVTGSAKLSEKGVLHLDFNVPSHMRKQGIGTEMFDDAVKTFGDDVKGIEGLWTYGSDGKMSDNLNSFINNVDWMGGSMSAKEAAFNTITGRWAKKNGFNNVSIITNEIDEVKVLFTKSQ